MVDWNEEKMEIGGRLRLKWEEFKVSARQCSRHGRWLRCWCFVADVLMMVTLMILFLRTRWKSSTWKRSLQSLCSPTFSTWTMIIGPRQHCHRYHWLQDHQHDHHHVRHRDLFQHPSQHHPSHASQNKNGGFIRSLSLNNSDHFNLVKIKNKNKNENGGFFASLFSFTFTFFGKVTFLLTIQIHFFQHYYYYYLQNSH